MGHTIEAIYDGAVFRPTVPVTLKPNTRVRERSPGTRGNRAGVSFLDTASSLSTWMAPQTGRQLGGKPMSPELTAVVEPFVRRGLFPNAEIAVSETRATTCCAK